MLINFLLNILVLLVVVTAADAREAVVVQSLNVKPYETLYQAFRSAYGGSVTRVVLSDGARDLARVIREERPKVLVAVGTEALLQARKFPNIPVVHAMVLNPAQLVDGARNISGIGMVVPPERQLALFRKTLPGAYNRIGVVYDGAASGGFIRAASAAARAAGIELVTREVKSVKDVPQAVASLRGHVDALWLIPDQTVVTPETVEYILLFGIENRLPVLAFSTKYLKMGALLSVDLDPADIGRQAADMARSAAAGDHHGTVPPRSAVPHVNDRVAKKLGVRLDDDLLRKLGANRLD